MKPWSRLLQSVFDNDGAQLKETTPLEQVEQRLKRIGNELTVLEPSYLVKTTGNQTIVTTSIPRMDGLEILPGLLTITIEPTKISLNNDAQTSCVLSIDADPAIRVPANNKAVSGSPESFDGDARKANLIAHRQLNEQIHPRSEGSAFNVQRL